MAASASDTGSSLLPTAPRETREAFVPIRTIAALRSLRRNHRPGPSAKVLNNLTES